MIILPAIDLYGGKVVRLTKGSFDERTEYGDDPFDVAQKIFDAGSRYLHIVDLEAAEVGYPKHFHILSKIANRLDMKVHFGGGLRTSRAITDAKHAGVYRAMVGSILFKKPESPRVLFDEFGELLIPSVDVKGGHVAVSGWKKETDAKPASFIADLFDIGFSTFLVTSVERDGMLAGPDLDLYHLLPCSEVHIIAAGGVTTVDDVMALKHCGVSSAVVGKALYEGKFDLKAAIEAVA